MPLTDEQLEEQCELCEGQDYCEDCHVYGPVWTRMTVGDGYEEAEFYKCKDCAKKHIEAEDKANAEWEDGFQKSCCQNCGNTLAECDCKKEGSGP